MTDAVPLVSVCIANYNGMGFIDACIESVRAQDCGFPVEILIHDDASTDGSAQHIREHHPDVTLIESSENVGFCIANNRMAAAARGKYLLLLNNDAELFPDALRTLHEEAVTLGRPAILGLPQYDHATGALIDIGSLLDPFLNPVPNLDPARQEVGMVIGACLWLSKPLWQELGSFPEWFDSIGEDLYLCCRARLTGHPVRALGESGYHHHVGQSFGGGKITVGGHLVSTRRRRALTERNKSFVMILTYPAPIFQFLLPLHLIMLAVEGALLSLVKHDLSLWRDIYLACLKTLWRKRAHLTAERRIIQMNLHGTAIEFFSVFNWLPHKLRMLWRHGLPEIR